MIERTGDGRLADGADADLRTGIYRGRRRRIRQRARSPETASLLSFVWPGLGQWYARRRLIGLIFAVPPALLLVALAVALALDARTFALKLLVPSFALAVVLAIAVHAVWRVAAIVDAWWRTRREALIRDRALPLVALLSFVVIAAHVFAGNYVISFAEAGEEVFGGQPNDSVGGEPNDSAGGPLDDILGPPAGQTPGPTAAPDATLAPGATRPPLMTPVITPPITPSPSPGPTFDPSARVTVLLVGVDSAPGRDHALTDTLIVASFDPVSREIVMISVPRDTGRIPMYDGGTYDDRINSLLGFARRDPARFPQGPVYALVREMEYLIGIPIHYYAVTDMAGLQKVVDLVGGVDITVDQPINDVGMGLVLQPGRYRMDGARALQYATSRHGPGNSDFERARRQQQIIYALAQRARDPAVLVRLPEVLDAASDLVRSDIPVESLPEFMAVLEQTRGAPIRQIVLAPNEYAQRIPPDEVGGRYMIELNMDAVAALSVELFGNDSRYASP